MTGAEQPSLLVDPEDMARAADADREAVAERLRIAAGEGRIDLAELDERLDQAFAAKTYGQLRVLVADLPVRPAAIPQPDAAPEPETLVLKTTTPQPQAVRAMGRPAADRRRHEVSFHHDRLHPRHLRSP